VGLSHLEPGKFGASIGSAPGFILQRCGQAALFFVEHPARQATGIFFETFDAKSLNFGGKYLKNKNNRAGGN
jgi:hypothetical protein